MFASFLKAPGNRDKCHTAKHTEQGKLHQIETRQFKILSLYKIAFFGYNAGEPNQP